jgi:hypothetical protein
MRPLRTRPLFIGAFLTIFAVAAGCGGGSSASQSDQDKAVSEAKAAFQKAQGQDLSQGPCIAERLPGLPDWAVDVAHDPRQQVDDQPSNQCQSFRGGQTHHFVELTPSGQLIRAQ